MNYSEAGRRIREARKLKGITQEEFAKRVGLSTMSVRRYETGERRATYNIFLSIAETLNVDANWLMYGETLEERDKKYIDKAQQRFDEAKTALESVTKNITTKTQQLNYGGRKRLSDYADDLYKVADYRVNGATTPDDEPPTE